MKIAIVGAGAMGSLFGAMLAEADVEAIRLGTKEMSFHPQRFDETFLAILTAHPERVSFTLPGERFGKSWARLLDLINHLWVPLLVITIGSTDLKAACNPTSWRCLGLQSPCKKNL